MRQTALLLISVLVVSSAHSDDLFGKREPDGDGSVVVSGELKQWHKVTLKAPDAINDGLAIVRR